MLQLGAQWFGFAAIVAGAWFYARRPFLGAVATLLGCVGLGTWAALQQPVPVGVFGVQVVVAVLQFRNAVIFARHNLEGRRVTMTALFLLLLATGIVAVLYSKEAGWL